MFRKVLLLQHLFLKNFRMLNSSAIIALYLYTHSFSVFEQILFKLDLPVNVTSLPTLLHQLSLSEGRK
jgi:hypothetical protein